MKVQELRNLKPLWAEVHRRLSAGTPVTRVTLATLTGPQREALADLLGMERRPTPGSTVHLDALEAAVAAATGHRLADVVTELIGPIGNRRQATQEETAARAALWSWLDHHPTIVGEPALGEWAGQVKRIGVLDGSVRRTRELLEQALVVLDALPLDGVPLPVFADRILGDPHGLDDNRRLSGLVLRALSCLVGHEFANDEPDRRSLWNLFGVDCDALSSTVLVVGLRAVSVGTAERILSTCADAGEGAVLTLAQLKASQARWRTGPVGLLADVHIVENPSVMAAALRRYGRDCPPLICVSGWPSAAAVLLLRTLHNEGVHLHYHGDFDGPGLRIAAHVIAKAGAHPWRMSTRDYLQALHDRVTGPPVGKVPHAPWDPDLAPAMEASGVCVPEESVVDLLLADLRPRPPKQAPEAWPTTVPLVDRDPRGR
jgi:uncharacterized protein (TIGR02679 family)